ncbi:MAG TPA: Ig-like domain-containing protein, partial [Candidatus Solibacter sp.]|nr:Ig-like domain-containing protein [Candidatus Solibacter sp.]
MKWLACGLLLAAAAFGQTDRPQLVSSNPANGQDSVNPATQIKLVFTKPMDLASLNGSTAVYLYDLSRVDYTLGVGYSSNMSATLSPDGLTATLTSYFAPMRGGAAYR